MVFLIRVRISCRSRLARLNLAARFGRCWRVERSAILEGDMSIPNVKRFRISSPDGSDSATLMTVIPKGTDLNAYLLDASARFDWKGHKEAKAAQFKVRVGQQKQQKKK